MADNPTLDNGALTDIVVATDDDGSAHHQYVKVEWGADNTQTKVASGASALPIQDGGNSITVDDGATTLSVDDGGSSLTVDNATISVVGSGTEATAQRVTIATDSTGVLSVDDNGSTLSIDDGGGNISIDDGGNSITTDNLALLVDDEDFTQSSTSTQLVSGVYESSPTSVTAGDIGAIGITSTRSVKVLDDNSDALLSAVTTLSNAVAADRSEINIVQVDAAVPITDNTTSITVDPGPPGGTPATLVWKNRASTSTDTGATIWDPTSGKSIGLTRYQILMYGTNDGTLTLWFGANADTTYTAGTDQLVCEYSYDDAFGPLAVNENFTAAITANTANHELHITTTNNLNYKLVCYGYEYTP